MKLGDGEIGCTFEGDYYRLRIEEAGYEVGKEILVSMNSNEFEKFITYLKGVRDGSGNNARYSKCVKNVETGQET